MTYRIHAMKGFKQDEPNSVIACQKDGNKTFFY